jgi:nitronate monooxygenase
LGSLPCALLTPDLAQRELGEIREHTTRPINANFFCQTPAVPDATSTHEWLTRLRPYFDELGLEPTEPAPMPDRTPFDASMCEVVEEFTPEVVSFHFGLPSAPLLERVRATGARVMSSATSVAEARWLEDHGCDAVIAQGVEAGGHRGMFLTTDVATQIGTMALVPQVVDAVEVPVIAAGGIGDARGIVAALALGAEGVQMGTAFLLCPEATTSSIHREALIKSADDATALTNVLTGRPARSVVNRVITELGPLSESAPPFPQPAFAMAPLRSAAEASGSSDFTPLWSGQAARFARQMPAAALVRLLADEAQNHLARLVHPDDAR